MKRIQRCTCETCKDCKTRKKARERYWNTDMRAKMRERNTGASAQDVAAMLLAQGGKCAICKETLQETGRHTHVDHDHKTGEVRGMLCRHCNIGLGKFKDSPERLLAAVAYLTGSA